MRTANLKRARRTAKEYIGNDLILKELGWGFDGCVFPTSLMTAVKVFDGAKAYSNELAVYSRLLEHNVLSVLGFAVPRLLGWNDDLLVIEMTIVYPPFVVDFAHATVDEPFPFTDEALSDWWAEKAELFEDQPDHFPVATEVFYALQEYGIFYYDIAPRNIDFRGHPRA